MTKYLPAIGTSPCCHHLPNVVSFVIFVATVLLANNWNCSQQKADGRMDSLFKPWERVRTVTICGILKIKNFCSKMSIDCKKISSWNDLFTFYTGLFNGRLFLILLTKLVIILNLALQWWCFVCWHFLTLSCLQWNCCPLLLVLLQLWDKVSTPDL